MLFNSPFSPYAAGLDPLKFRDAELTVRGERRATVSFERLRTLWFNTGSLCDLTCAGCYVESSMGNDTLVYLSLTDVVPFLDEIRDGGLPTEAIGLTGGEPFLNREIIAILDACLSRGFRTVVVTNGLRSMRRQEAGLLGLRLRFGEQLVVRVSLDHHDRAVHEAERGVGTWGEAAAGLVWLVKAGFRVGVMARCLPGESEAASRSGFAALFTRLGLGAEAALPAVLHLLPEIDSGADVDEVDEGGWAALGRAPGGMMCASSRMVVRRRGETARVASCVLLPYDKRFDQGSTLREARRTVTLNHPNCARFCVLGGGQLAC